ncbi:hypothetical protein [Methanoregula formicica]|uniref:Uncharacterized protein n=1 Tax=Methanoregula formicica (strain DSM 22288 / NBRC 105244 / SMSP) TaxID=593750 RepID=L0HEA4_METFS|nr:hypothetical protein [Methanoregula formicica]AGB01643.1 hypothetical protein Metfor_0580 [Methanoregula formicica SMSP]
MRRIIVLGVILLILCLAAGSVTNSGNSDDQKKVFLIVLGIHKNSIDLEEMEIRYGHSPNLGYQTGNFTVDILAKNGTRLFSFDIWDPRCHLEEYGLHNELVQHELMEDPELEQKYLAQGETNDIDLPLIIPYHNDIQSIEIRENETGALLISVNVSPAVDAFRARFPRDPDMMGNNCGQPDSLFHHTMIAWPF